MSSRNFDLSKFEVQGSTGFDAFFARDPVMVTPTKSARMRVASIQDLIPFTRISSETLIHKSERDLWSISRDATGGLYIERQFDDSGAPLKV